MFFKIKSVTVGPGRKLRFLVFRPASAVDRSDTTMLERLLLRAYLRFLLTSVQCSTQLVG